MEIILLSLSLLASASAPVEQTGDHRVSAHAVASAQIVSGERIQMDDRMFRVATVNSAGNGAYSLPLARSIEDRAIVDGGPITLTEFY